MGSIKARWANVWPCIGQGWNSRCLHPASAPLLSVPDIVPCTSSCDERTQEFCLGKFAVCLSEGPQRVRKKSTVTAAHDACSRQDGYCLGSGTGAAHVSLLLQGFFKCLQNLKARTIQQRPILQYINQIFLSWLMASGFCCWIFLFLFFFYCNTSGPYVTEIDNGWNLGSPEVSHKTHWLHWSHVFINCIVIFCISHMEEI